MYFLHGEPPVVYSDRLQTRDFTYIKDVVAANQQVLTDDSADGEVLNIGSTDNIDILTLAEEVRDTIDPSHAIEFAVRHDSDAEHNHADITKATGLLGCEPTKDIRTGVSSVIEWYRADEEWYDPLVRRS